MTMTGKQPPPRVALSREVLEHEVVRMLTRAAAGERHTPGGHPHNQKTHGSNDHGVDTPNLLDKLKLAGRIDLEDGERLLSSDKVSGATGVVRFALVEAGGEKALRLGMGGPGFGSRDDAAGPWRGGPDRTAEINAERERLRGERDDLEDELDDASPARKAAIQKRLDELDEMDIGGEAGAGGYTARLDMPAVQRLRATLADALEAGAIKQREVDAADDGGGPEPERPAAGFWTFTEGSIPGEWADVHYLVYLDDPSVGVETYLGAIPHGSGIDFDDLTGNEQAARLDPAEARKLVRLLTLDQPTRSVQTAYRFAGECECLRTFDFEAAADPGDGRPHPAPGREQGGTVNHNNRQQSPHKCGICRATLPPSLVRSRYVRRSAITGALLCDRCGTGPVEGFQAYPPGWGPSRIPKSREVLHHEVVRMLARAGTVESTPAERAAYHEAGHAVVAYRLGIPVDGVGLGEHGHGQTAVRSGDCPSLDVAAALIAGSVAESMWCPDSPGGEIDDGVGDDEARLHRLLSAESFDVRAAAASAQVLLERFAADVDDVAAALIERGSLTGKQVEALLQSGEERADSGVLQARAAYAEPIDERKFNTWWATYNRSGTADSDPAWSRPAREAAYRMFAAGDRGDWDVFRLWQDRLVDIRRRTGHEAQQSNASFGGS